MSSAKDPYEVLGVARTASPEEIKAAYRRASREAHPDRNGGDAARMSDVNVAYELLSDPERREHFDKTGSSSRTNIDEDANGQLRDWISQLLDKLEPHDDLVANLKLIAREALRLHTQALAEHVAKLERIRGRKDLVKRKDGGSDLYAQIIEQREANLLTLIPQIERAIAVVKRSGEIAAAFEWKWQLALPTAPGAGNTWYRSSGAGYTW